jgi:alpha-beta hydrolase superfamily lysophospholipase
MTSATAPSPAEPERRIPGVTPALRRRLRFLFRLLSSLGPSLAARVALWMFLRPRKRPVAGAEAGFLAGARRTVVPVRTDAGDAYEVQAYAWPAATGASAAAPAASGPATAGAAPTVLVMHGWISHAARLAPLIGALRAQGLRVIALDAPAHGRSSGSSVDLHGFLAAVRAVDAALGPAQGVIAHSFGALTSATWLAGDPPPSGVRAAVLVGLMRDVDWVFSSFTHTLGLRGRTLARLRALFRARYGGYPEEFGTQELARRIDIPVLLVHGEEDELVPAAHSTELGELLSNGEVLLVPGLQHSAPLKDPATMARMASFMAGQLMAKQPEGAQQ